MSEENKNLILFYSFTGNTREFAKETLRRKGGKLVEFSDAKPHSIRWAYTFGVLGALRGKSGPILPLEEDFSQYDHFTVLSPIWAGNAPPATNTILSMLPKQSTVSLYFVSSSGRSQRDRVLVRARKEWLFHVDEYVDVQA